MLCIFVMGFSWNKIGQHYRLWLNCTCILWRINNLAMQIFIHLLLINVWSIQCFNELCFIFIFKIYVLLISILCLPTSNSSLVKKCSLIVSSDTFAFMWLVLLSTIFWFYVRCMWSSLIEYICFLTVAISLVFFSTKYLWMIPTNCVCFIHC